jgi:hypothetical protein
MVSGSPSGFRSGQDQAILAYALTIGSILGDLGFRNEATASAWARYWLCDPADPAASAAAARDLTACLMADALPLSTVVDVHGRLAALEARHLSAGVDAAGFPDWLDACHARLVLLMASLEGERVCAGLSSEAVPDRATDHAVAALSEAATILNRSLGELRAIPSAARGAA